MARVLLLELTTRKRIITTDLARAPMDPFACLDLEPRPRLDPEAIDEAWRECSRELHPDCETGDREAFAALQTARAELVDPGRRLKALLAQVWPDSRPGLAGLDPELEPLFAEVQTLLPHATDFARRWQATGTRLARALLAREQGALLPELQATMLSVGAALAEAERRLDELDERFCAGEQGEELRQDLEDLRARFGWLGKWRGQLMELVGALL